MSTAAPKVAGRVHARTYAGAPANARLIDAAPRVAERLAKSNELLMLCLQHLGCDPLHITEAMDDNHVALVAAGIASGPLPVGHSDTAREEMDSIAKAEGRES